MLKADGQTTPDYYVRVHMAGPRRAWAAVGLVSRKRLIDVAKRDQEESAECW